MNLIEHQLTTPFGVHNTLHIECSALNIDIVKSLILNYHIAINTKKEKIF